MTVVEDEVRSAVWATDLARRVLRLAFSETNGIRHVAATRAVSRLDLARRLVEQGDIKTDLAVARRSDRRGASSWQS